MTSEARAVTEVVAPAAAQRHDLVWLCADAWERFLLSDLDPSQRALALHWFAAGYPAVVRRRSAHDPHGAIALGVPFPPARERVRLALSVAEPALRAVQRPPRLEDVVPAAPPAWREQLARLAALQDDGWCARVYGSLLWQSLTGANYLHAASDIDLLLEADSPAAWRRAAAALQQWEQDSGLRADGEILLRNGLAVAWRELAAAPARVLAKSVAGVELMPGAAAIGLLAAEPA